MQTNIIKTIVSPLYIKEILHRNYKLNNIYDVILIKSSINDTYKVFDSNNQYIFKVYHCQKDINDLEIEIDFIHYLKNNNLLVASPLITKNGTYILSINYPEGIRFAILTYFIEGDELTYKNTEDAYIYGQSVGNLHRISKKFTPFSRYKKYDIYKKLINSKYIIENFLLYYYFNYSYSCFFLEFSEKLLEKIKKLNLTQQYCHNDLHGGNAKKVGKQIFFFDFDFFGCGYTIYELAVFKWSCIIGNRHDAWNNYIKGYESILKISINEMKYLMYFVAIRDIIIMSQYIENIDTIGHEIINHFYIKKRMLFLKNINSKIEGGK